jgi:hypothetical protein
MHVSYPMRSGWREKNVFLRLAYLREDSLWIDMNALRACHTCDIACNISR